MPNSWESVDVGCPFYRASDGVYIRCEGLAGLTMTIEEFRKTMAEVEYIPAGSELHQAFHAFSQEALKITAKLNGAYHTP